MNAIKSVLATTDFSPLSVHAAARAAMLAATAGARCTISNVISRGTLNALHDLMSPDSSDELEQSLLEDALTKLQNTSAELKTRFGIDSRVAVSAGSVMRQIVNQAESSGADLIVMGAHGSGFVRDILIGSTTDRVLRQTTRPMLVVRRPAQQSYRRVLLPVDFSARSAAAISLVRTIAPDAELFLLHVFDVPYEGHLRMAGIAETRMKELKQQARDDAGRQLEEFSSKLDLGDAVVHPLLAQGKPADAITDTAKENACDLIAMGKQGLRMIEEIVLGSVTRQVLSQTDCDVLVADRKLTK